MRLTLTQQVALQGEAKIRGLDPFIGDALPNSAVDFTMPRLVDGQAATVDCCIATITVRAYDFGTSTEQIDQFRDFVLKAVQDRLDAMTMQEFAAMGLLLEPRLKIAPDCGEYGHADGACGTEECLPSNRSTQIDLPRPPTDCPTPGACSSFGCCRLCSPGHDLKK